MRRGGLGGGACSRGKDKPVTNFFGSVRTGFSEYKSSDQDFGKIGTSLSQHISKRSINRTRSFIPNLKFTYQLHKFFLLNLRPRKFKPALHDNTVERGPATPNASFLRLMPEPLHYGTKPGHFDT